LARLDGRVEVAARGPGQYLHIALGVVAGAHRPDDLLQVGDVDIVIDHDDDAVEIRTLPALAGYQRRLFGVPGVPLLDGDHVEQSATADAVRPGRDHIRNTGGSYLAAEVGAASILLEPLAFVRRLLRWATEENRVVPVVDGFHPEHRLLLLLRRVVPGPLTERPL